MYQHILYNIYLQKVYLHIPTLECLGSFNSLKISRQGAKFQASYLFNDNQ